MIRITNKPIEDVFTSIRSVYFDLMELQTHLFILLEKVVSVIKHKNTVIIVWFNNGKEVKSTLTYTED